MRFSKLTSKSISKLCGDFQNTLQSKQMSIRTSCNRNYSCCRKSAPAQMHSGLDTYLAHALAVQADFQKANQLQLQLQVALPNSVAVSKPYTYRQITKNYV
jgi:(p)ppGpp synthase/HD superfamily hydrolase